MAREEVLARARRVLDEAEAKGIALDHLAGNSAKLRLVLDLVDEIPEAGRLRVLDVGCGGRFHPFNLWEPLVPLAERIELEGCDVEYLEATARRAAEVGFPVRLRHVSATELTDTYESESFDAVVSTQVLEHLPDWRRGVAEMAELLKPGAALLITCDSGDRQERLARRLRLGGKRVYSRLAGGVPPLKRVLRPLASADWERAPRRGELDRQARSLGLVVERFAYHCARDVKGLQKSAGSTSRLLWLALEEALADETNGRLDSGLFDVLYLRARRPSRKTGS